MSRDLVQERYANLLERTREDAGFSLGDLFSQMEQDPDMTPELFDTVWRTVPMTIDQQAQGRELRRRLTRRRAARKCAKEKTAVRRMGARLLAKKMRPYVAKMLEEVVKDPSQRSAQLEALSQWLSAQVLEVEGEASDIHQ